MKSHNAVLVQQGAASDVHRIVAVCQIDSGSPADLSGCIAEAEKCTGGNADRIAHGNALLHQRIQHAGCVKSAPAAALQDEAAFPDLLSLRKSLRDCIQMSVNFNFSHGKFSLRRLIVLSGLFLRLIIHLAAIRHTVSEHLFVRFTRAFDKILI